MNQHQYSFEISTQYTEMDQKIEIAQLVEQLLKRMEEEGVDPIARYHYSQQILLNRNQAPNQILNQNNSQNQPQIPQPQQIQQQMPPLELRLVESIGGLAHQQDVIVSNPMISSSKKSENLTADDVATGRHADEARHLYMVPAHDDHVQQNPIGPPQTQNVHFVFINSSNRIYGTPVVDSIINAYARIKCPNDIITFQINDNPYITHLSQSIGFLHNYQSIMLLHYLKKVDRFGVPIRIRTSQNTTSYRSVIGGILTLITYSVSLAYFIFVLAQWRTGAIPPTTQTTSKAADTNTIKFETNQVILQFYELDEASGTSNPLLAINNIITPIMYCQSSQKLGNFNITSNYNPAFTSIVLATNTTNASNTTSSDPDDKKRLDMGSSAQQLQSGTHIPQIDGKYTAAADPQQIIIAFVRCQQQYLQPGSTCANTTTIDSYLKDLKKLLCLTIQLQYYDTTVNKFNTVNKTYYFSFDSNNAFFTQVFFQSTVQKENQGIIFDKIEQRTFVSSVQINTQQITSNFSKDLIGIDSMAIFLFRPDTIQVAQTITYPNLGQVLAQVSSIAQVILVLQYLAYEINKRFLNESMINDLIGLYYEQYKAIRIQRNKLFRTQSIEYKNKPLDKQKFGKLYEELKKEAEQKLSILGIFTELTRIERFLQRKYGYECFDESGRERFNTRVLKLPYLQDEFDTDHPQAENIIVHQTQYKMECNINDIFFRASQYINSKLMNQYYTNNYK